MPVCLFSSPCCCGGGGCCCWCSFCCFCYCCRFVSPPVHLSNKIWITVSSTVINLQCVLPFKKLHLIFTPVCLPGATEAAAYSGQGHTSILSACQARAGPRSAMQKWVTLFFNHSTSSSDLTATLPCCTLGKTLIGTSVAVPTNLHCNKTLGWPSTKLTGGWHRRSV